MAIFDNLKKAFSGEKEKSEQEMENMIGPEEIIYSPMSGEVMDISQCEDPVFAQEIVGKGVLIVPSQGVVYSPIDGTVSMLAETGHAIGLTSEYKTDVLIHIGLDTVELNGGPFNIKVKSNDKVKKGDVLIEFDIEKIKEGGKSIQSPVIITNPEGKELEKSDLGHIDHGDKLMTIR